MKNRIVDEEIQRIISEGPKSEHLTKSRDNMLKRHNERLQENSYWLNVIDSYYFRGLDAYTNYKKTLESITADDIKKFMSDFSFDPVCAHACSSCWLYKFQNPVSIWVQTWLWEEFYFFDLIHFVKRVVVIA